MNSDSVLCAIALLLGAALTNDLIWRTKSPGLRMLICVVGLYATVALSIIFLFASSRP